MGSGPLQQISMRRLSVLPGPTDKMNGPTTTDTLLDYSQQNLLPCTHASLSMKKQSELELAQGQKCSSLTKTDLMTCGMQFLTPVESTIAGLEAKKVEQNNQSTSQVAVQEAQDKLSVNDGTPQLDVHSIESHVFGGTSANNVEENTRKPNALKTSKTEVLKGNIPKYLRYNYYNYSMPLLRTLVQWSLTAKPLPILSSDKLSNTRATKTLAEHPDLFKIITPINVNLFQQLVTSHPNQPFVVSVIKSLKEGFWPFANTKPSSYPLTCDMSSGPPGNKVEADFLRSQRDIKIAAEQFSNDFGSQLFDGMYSFPIHAVPKPKSSDLHLVTNQSAGQFSLNSMITHNDISGFPMDNMKHLGDLLLCIRDRLDKSLILWKSDVANAY